MDQLSPNAIDALLFVPTEANTSAHNKLSTPSSVSEKQIPAEESFGGDFVTDKPLSSQDRKASTSAGIVNNKLSLETRYRLFRQPVPYLLEKKEGGIKAEDYTLPGQMADIKSGRGGYRPSNPSRSTAAVVAASSATPSYINGTQAGLKNGQKSQPNKQTYTTPPNGALSTSKNTQQAQPPESESTGDLRDRLLQRMQELQRKKPGS